MSPARYRAFRDDDGHYSQTYWNLLAIRLAFVIVFEVTEALVSFSTAPTTDLHPFLEVPDLLCLI